VLPSVSSPFGVVDQRRPFVTHASSSSLAAPVYMHTFVLRLGPLLSRQQPTRPAVGHAVTMVAPSDEQVFCSADAETCASEPVYV
jgi:hypothetical protein